MFLTNSPLVILTSPDLEADGPAGTTLLRPYFGMHRTVWPDDTSVEFHLPHGEWIGLLRDSGFEVERLVELQPRPGRDDTYTQIASLEWARQWPSEEAWFVAQARLSRVANGHSHRSSRWRSRRMLLVLSLSRRSAGVPDLPRGSPNAGRRTPRAALRRRTRSWQDGSRSSRPSATGGSARRGRRRPGAAASRSCSASADEESTRFSAPALGAAGGA